MRNEGQRDNSSSTHVGFPPQVWSRRFCRKIGDTRESEGDGRWGGEKGMRDEEEGAC